MFSPNAVSAGDHLVCWVELCPPDVPVLTCATCEYVLFWKQSLCRCNDGEVVLIAGGKGGP